MARKKQAASATQTYVVLRRIANKQGDQVWERGATIELADAAAQTLLIKGAIEPHGETVAPNIEPVAPVIHTGGGDDGNTSSTE